MTSPVHQHRRRAAQLVVGAVLALLALLQLTGPAAAGPAEDEQQFVALVNRARAAGGVAPLEVHGELTALGRSWAGSMAAAGGISHNPGLASQVSAPWLVLGENVGRGGSVQAVFDALMASPSHRRNILDGRFTHIGVGVVHAPDGLLYTSHQFMQLGAAPAPPPPAPVAAPAAAPPPPPAAEIPPPAAAPADEAAPIASAAASLRPPTTVPLADRTRPEPAPTTRAAATAEDADPIAAAPAPTTAASGDAPAPSSTAAATVAVAGATPLTVAYLALRRRRSRRTASGAARAA